MKKTWCRGGVVGGWRSVLLAMMVMPAVAQATIYTGTDANGIRWFSDTAPPRGEPVQTLSLSAGMATNAAPVVPSGAVPSGVVPSAAVPPGVVFPGVEPAAKATAVSAPSVAPGTKRTSARKPPSQTLAPRKRSAGKSSRRQAPTMTRQARQTARLQQHCQSVEHALRKINAQMRAGYRARQGQRLRQRRQVLLDQQFADCPTRASR